MTTIAISRTEVAADGQRTYYDQIRGLAHKKLRIVGDAIYAYTGLVPLMEPMIKWHKDGADPEKLPKGHDNSDGWALIVIDRSGLWKYTSSCPYKEEFDPPIAFGAGCDYALGAMLQGASARRAIEIVSGLCNHTGGEIQVVDIAETTGFTLRVVEQNEAAE